jgi:hypothetical protein
MASNIKEEIEDKIIDWIALGSGGRLIAVKPENGPDLVVQRRGDYHQKEIVFIIKSFIKPTKEDNFQINDVPKGFDSKKNYFLLCVIFDEIAQKIEEKVWLVPFTDLKGVEVFESKSYAKYLIDKKDFTNFLIDKLVAQNKAKKHAGFQRKVY